MYLVTEPRTSTTNNPLRKRFNPIRSQKARFWAVFLFFEDFLFTKVQTLHCDMFNKYLWKVSN